jgi:hypothetical protein
VSSAEVLVGNAKIHPADALQAQYFRDMLVDKLQLVAEDLAACRVRLANRVESGALYAIARVRREVSAMEGERHELESLIAAIDRRFAGHLAQLAFGPELNELSLGVSFNE